MHQLAYMCAPVRGDVQANLADAEAWFELLRAITEGLPLTIIAPWITAMRVGGDTDSPATRKRGLLDDVTVTARCDGTIGVGHVETPSEGMQDEINACRGWHLDLLPITSRFARRVREVDDWVQRAIRDAVVAQMSTSAGIW